MLIFSEIEPLHCPVTRGASFLFRVDMCIFSEVQSLACNPLLGGDKEPRESGLDKGAFFS